LVSQDIKRNWADYQKRFVSRDKLEQDKATEEELTRRRKLLSEWQKWHNDAQARMQPFLRRMEQSRPGTLRMAARRA
jgi:hypothetical protein